MTASTASASSQSVELLLADLLERATRDIREGKPVDLDALPEKYPDHADQLRPLLPAVQLLADLSRSQDSAEAIGEFSDVSAFTEPLGDFRLIREVGRGGMGIVYEAEQLSLNRRVALKVLPFAATMDPRHLQRFRNEAQAAACLHHANIVPVHGVGCERGVHYYAMQLIEGQTLAEVIQNLTPRPPSRSGKGEEELQRRKETDFLPSPPASGGEGMGVSGDSCGAGVPPAPAAETAALRASTKRDRTHFRTIATLIASAADALEYAHSMGVVHRDIKPGNLMLDNAGHLWITDFGLAKLANPAREGGGELTMTGDLLGTLRYMSPEQALAKHGLVDHRTDIYSLGATLYELLTLKPAVEGADKAEILKAIAWEEPTPLRKHDKSIAAELETITLKCLAKEPSERYTTAGEVAEDLRRWLESKPIVAKPPTWLDRAGKWAGRHRLVVSLLLAFVLTTTAGLAAGIVLLQRAHQEEAAQRDRAKQNLRVALKALDEAIWPAFEPLIYRGTPPSPEEVKPLETLLAFYEEFARQNADDRQLRFEMTKARLQTGLTFAAMGNAVRAEQELRQAVAEARSQADERPDKTVLASQLALMQFKLGEFLRERGRLGEAQTALSEAVRISEAHWTDSADSVDEWTLAESHWGLALLTSGGSQPADAEDHFRSALRYQKRKVAREPEGGYAHGRLGLFLSGFANWLVDVARPDEAEHLIRQAIALTEKTVQRERRNSGWSLGLRDQYVVLARIADARNRPDDWCDAAKNQVAILERLAADFPELPNCRGLLNESYYGLALRLLRWNRHTEALPWFAKVPEAATEYAESALARARIRLTAPDEKLRDPAEALRLTTWGTEKLPESGPWLTIHAFAQHRTGDSKTALATVERARKAPEDGEVDLFFIHAMILHKLGERDRARQQCATAIDAMNESKRDSDDGILRVFRREALAELGLTEADFAKHDKDNYP